MSTFRPIIETPYPGIEGSWVHLPAVTGVAQYHVYIPRGETQAKYFDAGAPGGSEGAAQATPLRPALDIQSAPAARQSAQEVDHEQSDNDAEARRQFTAIKLRRLDRQCPDHRLDDFAFRLSHHLAGQYLSRTTGYADPTLGLLAAIFDVSESTVYRAPTVLARLGYWRFEGKGGRRARQGIGVKRFMTDPPESYPITR